MHQHLCTDCRTFYHTSVRRQISFEYCQTACLTVRIVNRRITSGFLLTHPSMFSPVSSVTVYILYEEVLFFVQLIHHRINSAGLVEIFHVCIVLPEQDGTDSEFSR